MASRAILKVGTRCNSDCLFCHVGGPGAAGRDLDGREVCRRIAAVAEAGHEGVVLSGGEATARSDLLALARFAQGRGLTVGLVTNGRRLASPRRRRELLDAGLDYVHVSLHGPSASSHGQLAGVDSFEQAASAVEAFSGEAVDLAVTTVVCRQNLDLLEETAELVGALLTARRGDGFRRHRLALVEPKGRALDNSDVLPEPSLAAERVGRVLAMPSPHPCRRGHDGFPPCLLGPGAPAPDDLRAHRIVAMQEPEDARLHPTDAGRRAYAPQCDGCGSRARCPGIFAGYLPAFEDCLVPP